jgi:hypothetical protein
MFIGIMTVSPVVFIWKFHDLPHKSQLLIQFLPQFTYSTFMLRGKGKGKDIPVTDQWRPIGLREVKAPTLLKTNG